MLPGLGGYGDIVFFLLLAKPSNLPLTYVVDTHFLFDTSVIGSSAILKLGASVEGSRIPVADKGYLAET